MKRVTIVYISGFMTPSNMICFPEDSVPADVDIITVYPSPVGSIHDRVCQVFYELKGGVVDYGEEHSHFHDHQRFGKEYKAKFPRWDADHPVFFVGHSLGGLTAWTLHNYLANGRFHGHSTTSSWITGIVLVNTPLNGALQVYNKGMNVHLPALLHWLSLGHCVGMFAQTLSFLDLPFVKQFFDPELAHWRLAHKHSDSLLAWLLCFFGYGVYSTSDHIAYDTALHSQLEWHRYNALFPDTFYCSLVGNLAMATDADDADAASTRKRSWLNELITAVYEHVRAKPPSVVGGRDTSHWFAEGHDGLLSTFTQEYPRLHQSPAQLHKATSGSFHHEDFKLHKGTWYHYQVATNHLTVALQGRQIWREIFDTVLKMQDHHEDDASAASVASDTSAGTSVESFDATDVDVVEADSFQIVSLPAPRSAALSKRPVVAPKPTAPQTTQQRTPDMQDVELVLSQCHVALGVRDERQVATFLLWMAIVAAVGVDYGTVLLSFGLATLVACIRRTSQPAIAWAHGVQVLCSLSVLCAFAAGWGPQRFVETAHRAVTVETFLLLCVGRRYTSYTAPLCKLASMAVLQSLLSTSATALSHAYLALSLLPLASCTGWLFLRIYEQQAGLFTTIRRACRTAGVPVEGVEASRYWLRLMQVTAVVAGVAQWACLAALSAAWCRLATAASTWRARCAVIALLGLLLRYTGVHGNEQFCMAQYALMGLQSQLQDARLCRPTRWPAAGAAAKTDA